MEPRVASLHVYPVKGLKGIDLAESRATESTRSSTRMPPPSSITLQRHS